jgi:hypothetical protein
MAGNEWGDYDFPTGYYPLATRCKQSKIQEAFFLSRAYFYHTNNLSRKIIIHQ